ncbi:tetratricopeptide repeat-containing diguanylate cyclase [Alkalimonas sp.]|uniref:tetratricopeptide repeat-containing diguanylate cyclase n=1 Tax=Alkalimonas sp. TaxID=1872453 RepID=UPI00263B45EC|nr:tetratricopeptide repeat-containing diguanylate cyclase [Alkalimonas sp.]MCC5827456.1 GGDEF domain-containing protein [Alkalimonas sp.]
MCRMFVVFFLSVLSWHSLAERVPRIEQQLDAVIQFPLRFPDAAQLAAWEQQLHTESDSDTWYRVKALSLLQQALAPEQKQDGLSALQTLLHQAEPISTEAQLEVLNALLELQLHHQLHAQALALVSQVESLLLHEVTPRLQFELLLQLGRVLKVNGELEQALSFFLRAHHEILQLDGAGTNYRRQYLQLQLARIQSRLQNYRYSIQIASQALQVATELELSILLPELHLIRGAGMQMSEGTSEQVIADFKQAAKAVYPQAPGRTQMMALNNLGAVYMHLKEFEKANRYFQQSVAIAETLHNDRELHVTRFNIGYVKVLQGLVEQGLPIMEQAYAAFINQTTPGLQGIMLGHLADAYHEAGLYMQENEALRQQRQIRDQVLAIERDRVYTELQVQFEAQEQGLRIQLLEQANALRDERLKRAQRERTLYIGLVTILLLSLIGLLSAMRHVRLLNAQLDDLSKRDPLTQLFNRRALQDMRHASGDLLVLLDVDHFKQINDSYGHDKGDEVLTCLAERLLSSVRKEDRVLRWGGEEFLLILRGVEPGSAAESIEKIRCTISRESIAELDVTVSGGAVLLDQGQSMQKALKQADDLLYQAKAGGRRKIHYQWPDQHIEVLS